MNIDFDISIDDDNNENYSDNDLYQIKSWGADLSFRELIQMYAEDELIKPELQRNYVWEKKEASRFIESILLGLPIPSIFLAVDDKTGNKIIIDGYQRIMTVYDFIHTGIWKKTNETFKLTNSKEINEKWRGKSFAELELSDRKKIRSTTIHTIMFEQTKPSDNNTSLFQIFERINTGGRTLTPQEIRNCVSQGPLNTLLIELNENEVWRELWGADYVDSRMKDIEFILRFFYLYDFMRTNTEAKQILMKKELNLYMKSSDNQKEEKIEELKKLFIKTMEHIKSYFGTSAFYKTTKFHPSIFDSIAVATALSLDQPTHDDENLYTKRQELIDNETFITFTTQRTTNVENIRGRINLAKEILYDE